MKALLLAAGFGTRLLPLTNQIPKCLVKINEKPLLQYWIDILKKSTQCNEIFINTHYKSEEVKHFIEKCNFDNTDVNIKVFHEKTLLGTAGTVRHLINCTDGLDKNESLFVAHADNLTHFNFDDFIGFHEDRPKNAHITMMTFLTDSPENSGIVELNSSGIIKKFHEKSSDPPGNLANGAVYVFSNIALKAIVENDYITDLSTELIPLFLNEIISYFNNTYHRDIGTTESLKKANIEYKKLLEHGILKD